MRMSLFLTLLLPTMVAAQAPSGNERGPAWSRSPREIPFQNDSQWEDNRWQATDVGPFLAASVRTREGMTLKGLAIRVGDEGQAAVCFDTARLRISTAWTGEFLRFGPRRFGLIDFPAAGGETFFSTRELAGWARDGRFEPQPDEITQPGIERGASVVHLPQDWAAYRGMYTSGRRVVLSYSVGASDVLDSPWYVESAGEGVFVRSLQIGPSSQTMQMGISDSESWVTAIGDAAARVETTGGRSQLIVAPHDETVRVKLLIARNEVAGQALGLLRRAAGDAEDLSQLIRDDAGRWPGVLTTEGQTTESGGPYVIDTLTLPFENPYGALLFTAGHDFFSDGTAAICTVHGDVWTVAGIDRDLKELRWRRFATGLYQPLGLKIVDDKVYVIGRDQVTRLHDRNGDGEADFYENFNNDLFITARAHNFVTCLETDPEGNFYFIHAITGVMRVSSDGSTMTAVADGFRNPNGLGVSPDGMITAAPQQGTWTPESSLIVVKEGGYYGYGGPRITTERPTGWDLPMCFIPRVMDNSGGGQVWVEGDRWGPLTGRMLHLSYGQCRLLLALTEDVDGVWQGGAIRFPTTPSDFESGVMRGRFNPHDGQLYVSGLRGWQTRAIRDGCFQRVRYIGGPVHLPTGVKTYTNGMSLTFSEPLDVELAGNPENYLVEQWNYLWSAEYGSPDFSVENPQQQKRDEVPVVSATLLDDGCSVFLEMPGRQPVNQISISWLLGASGGERFRGTYAHTINAPPRQTFPDARIIRRAPTRRIAEEVEDRLEPGLQFRFESTDTGDVDARASRLAVLRQPIDSPATPFLQAGPFSLEVTGTLHTPLSGFYDFRIEGADPVRLWINDELIIDPAVSRETAEPILLHKGHNRVQIQSVSPSAGLARWRLSWKGDDFNWEPVPPGVLFHDSGSPELVAAQQRRLGRTLFADHHCANCHRTDVGPQPMLELSLSPPDLAAAGDRFHQPWLVQWLLAPESLRPGTPMPSVLGEGDGAAQAAADIAAFLLSQHATQTVESETETAGDPDGEALYESLGCMTCHHFRPPNETDDFDRLSLYYVNARYPDGALTAFLRKPGAHDSATGMPDFHLSGTEADALARFVREKASGEIQHPFPSGDVARGRQLFGQAGCRNCHSVGENLPVLPPQLDWKQSITFGGCLADGDTRGDAAPAFRFTDDERSALLAFVRNDLPSLRHASDVETSARLFDRLQCARCHDRDGRRSQRPLVIAEEGSGRVPEVLPALTWAGERFIPAWTEALLAGRLEYKPRPWITARMPAFPGYAAAVAHGLAAEHGVDSREQPARDFDPELAAIGERLTLQTGLDCRQCHGIGDLEPRGDEQTKIALGVNFSFIRDRMRREAYDRFMLDPPRYDINTRMIRLSEDGLTTKLKDVFDSDAHQQFDAVWNYIQSLPGE